MDGQITAPAALELTGNSAPEVPEGRQTGETTALSSIWTSPQALSAAWKAARFLSTSDLVPDAYRGKAENCLIALDLANRAGISPLTCMQQLNIIKGRPSWASAFCIAACNASGRFTPLEFIETDEDGGSCRAEATRLSDGVRLRGPVVSLKMAEAEGWTSRPGSKWRTLPQLMARYRAATFFARTYCPDVLLGLHTADEIRDISGDDEVKTTVRLKRPAAVTEAPHD